jgi:hypothetical protein
MHTHTGTYLVKPGLHLHCVSVGLVQLGVKRSLLLGGISLGL